MPGPSTPDAEMVAAVREALPAVGAGIYLDTPVAGPLPAETAAAMDEIAGWELRTGRVYRHRADDVAERVDEARAAVAAILATDLEDVSLAPGIDAALVGCLRSVAWQSGDRLVIVDDPETARLAELAPPGITVELVDPGDDLVAAAAQARLVSLPLVSATTGGRLPVEPVAAAAHARGAQVLVDASLALGAVPVERRALGADLLVARSDAWLLGPEGMAIVAGTGAQPAHAPRLHLPSVVGLARGCGWLSMYVGLPWIHARTAAMVAEAAERLSAIPGVTLVTPGDRAAVLVFTIDGWPAERALEELGGRIFLLASAVGPDALRIGVGFWTRSDELERLAGAVGLLAAHDPASLPARPRITILGAGA